MDKINKFVNFMRDYVFARSVIPIGIIVIAIGIYASSIYGDRKDYPRCEATVTDSELLSGSRRIILIAEYIGIISNTPLTDRNMKGQLTAEII